MLDIILVHGAYHGGWCWSATARALLNRSGVRVHTPTLTGLADRRHLFSPAVNLSTHVDDIVNLIDFEPMDEVVLVGHSYAGNVLTCVGDRLRDRISHYVFVDASVAPDGSTHWGWGHLVPESLPGLLAKVKEEGNGVCLPPPPATAFGIADAALIEQVEPKLTPMPRGCLEESVALNNGGTEGLKRSYIAANNPPYERMANTVSWISNDPNWTLVKIDACHDMMVTHPTETAELLWQLITA